MKYCTHCGAENDDEAVICPKCGCYVDNKQKNSNKEQSSTLKLVAFILCLLSTIASAFALIPLAGCIPMTIAVYKNYNGEKELSTAFKVCTLIFVNLIAGILLLIDDKNK